MRVCHVSPHLPPDQAANAILPAELGSWLHALGHEVTFVTQAPAQGGSPAASPVAGPVRRIRGRGARTAFMRWTRLDTWRRAREINTALDEMARQADLLHLHSNGLIVEVAAAWARRHEVPVVLTLYGTEIWHYRRRWPIDPFTAAYRRARAVTFYSRGLLDRAMDLGLGRAGLSVIYPPVSAVFQAQDEPRRGEWRAALGIREPRVILNVKRLHELAGQRYLIEAFAGLRQQRRDVRLVCCGTGPLRAALEQQARAANVADAVTFAGLVPNEIVARYTAVADVFALPSLLEALPTVAVEALACATPVVSADHPGGHELHALFGDDVRLVPRRDAGALAGALAAAVDRPRRTHPATAGLVESHFRRAAIESAYLEVYRQVLGSAA
jgi:glycosyltransferase involved in cell wall biosynthesis